MTHTRAGQWLFGSDGRQYLIYRYVEVNWRWGDNDSIDCQRGQMYYETSTGLRVIRIGVAAFKIVTSGVYLADEVAADQPEGRTNHWR